MIDVLAFGEVLWDVIDGVPHIGGAPFNLAAHAAKCGLSASIVSAVGRDDLGRRALEEARRLGVATDFIEEHPTRPTGTVNVTLGAHGIPSYEIVKPVAWDEIGFSTSADINPRAFCQPGAVRRTSHRHRRCRRLFLRRLPGGHSAR